MAISRNSGVTGSGGGSTTQATQTQTQGPRTDTSTTIQNANSSQSGTSSQSTVGGKTTNTDSTKTTSTKNMSDKSLAALENLIAQLQKGGTPQDQQRWDQIQSEIKANVLQQQQYSKESAQYDADTAAKAAQYEALQQLTPTIAAGIDSAGTSGSSMAALLAQNAADQAARASAKLQLDTMVNYGQIKNQASGNNVELLKIQNPVTQQLLAALDIAKGATQTTTENIKGSEKSNWFENMSGSSSSTSQSSSTTNQVNNTGAQTTTTNSNVTETPTGTTGSTGSKATQNTGANSGQYFITPSSYKKTNQDYYKSGNSYSQFGT